jgi:TPR repeat protein
VLLYFVLTKGYLRKNLNIESIIKLYDDKKYFLAEKSFLLLSNSDKISDIEKAKFYYQLARIYISSDILDDALEIKRNNQKAFHYIKKASSLGHFHATFLLGWIYEFGKIVNDDITKAIEYYELAIKQEGTGFYKISLGRLYLEGKGVNKDFDTGIKLYEESANSDNPRAQFRLGEFYETGEHVEKNIDLAIGWFEKAANNGNEEAKEKLKKLTKPKKSKKEAQA